MTETVIVRKRPADSSESHSLNDGDTSYTKSLQSLDESIKENYSSPIYRWKLRRAMQDGFAFTDPLEMAKVERQLQSFPPLVQPTEVKRLNNVLAEVYEGRRFILQAGDCAERFVDCSKDLIEVKLKIILQMSLVLSWAGRIPIVKIGRIAGQYAKPRTTDFETVDGKQVVSFRGDSINGFDLDERTPNPQRLIKAYFFSCATLNFIRSLISSGFADLKELDHWKLDFFNSKDLREEYDKMVHQMLNALYFMDTCGITFDEGRKTIDFYTSHEALVLPYEAAMTRKVEGKFYNTSAHMLWIGERTRQLDHSHVEYCRMIENPIGVKLGPTAKPSEAVALCKILNPQNKAGKIILISRLGASQVKNCLPPLIKAISEANLKVVWQCDPMHGNTEKTSSQIKTRQFGVILEELLVTFDTHRTHGTFLGGVHLELTGENVTECMGGPQDLCEKDLALRYTTYCDPRLNYAQSMEIAFQLAKRLSCIIPQT